MESASDFHLTKALLTWQMEMGATEAIGDMPVDRYALEKETAPTKKATSQTQTAPAPSQTPSVDKIAIAREIAATATCLTELHQVIAEFDYCNLKKGARNTVFADGNASAKIMVVGEAPGRDEDIQGKPFVGRAGQLLDKMLAAIGLSRDAEDAACAVHITNVLPWRPPQNREPTPEEIAMLVPFLERQIELVAPEIIIAMGNTPCQALLGRRGITRIRGSWAQAQGIAVMPMFHPAYLLRNPAAKREAWADLLEIKAKMGAS